MSEFREVISRVFEERLRDALRVACNGQTAIVIVPPPCPKHFVLNWLVRHAPPELSHTIRTPGAELHFEGTRGSVRVYASDHVEYDRKQRRMLSYPASVPHFLYPEIEL